MTDRTTPEVKNRTVDRWRQFGSEILSNNFILTWNHGLTIRSNAMDYINVCPKVDE